MVDKWTRQLTGKEGVTLMRLFMSAEQAKNSYVRYGVEILESRGLSTDKHRINLDTAEIEEVSNAKQVDHVD